MTTPLSVLADGNLKVLWVPAIAVQTAPTVAELTGASVVDLSCYLTPDGYTPGDDEQEVIDDRLCSTQTYSKPGRSSKTLEIMYIFQPQLPAATDNKAYSTLVFLTTGFIVERWGKLFSSAVIATDRVDVKPAQCGKQRKQPPEANSVFKIAQKIYITGAVNENTAVSA